MAQDKPEFSRLEKLATDLLLGQDDFDTLKINVQQLKYDYPIAFDSIQHYCQVTKRNVREVEIECLNNGCTLVISEGYLILYNQEHSLDRINWTLAHEVGHVYAGHTRDGEKEEIEAHFFAAQLLMPEAVIRKLKNEIGFLDFGWIYCYFFVSLQSSIKRVNTLNSKYYTKNRDACLLLNKFHSAISDLVSFSRNDYQQFHLDIEYAHALLDDVQEPFKNQYILNSPEESKKFLPLGRTYIPNF